MSTFNAGRTAPGGGRELIRLKIGDKRYPYILGGNYGGPIRHKKNWAQFVQVNNHSKPRSIKFPAQAFGYYVKQYHLAKGNMLSTDVDKKHVCDKFISITKSELESLILSCVIEGEANSWLKYS